MAARDWAEKDFYKVLGVSKNASKDEIKRAYRKLAQKYHPDANKGDRSAEARFKEISEAHAILSNDDKRKEYDQLRSFVEAGGQRFYGFGPDAGGRNVRVNIGDIGDLFGDAGVGSIFEDLFGAGTGAGDAGFGFGRSRSRARGGDLETEVTLSFDEAIRGTTVTLPNGAKARIPAGVGDGARIKVAGKGQAAAPGMAAGDLYVRVHVQEHPLFKRRPGGDLLVEVPVTLAEAALGAKIEVPTLDGSVTVKVPAGAQHGKLLRVKGRGAPRPKGGNGDLLAQIHVVVPTKLTRREKELLEQFQQVHGGSPREHFARFVDDARRKVS